MTKNTTLCWRACLRLLMVAVGAATIAQSHLAEENGSSPNTDRHANSNANMNANSLNSTHRGATDTEAAMHFERIVRFEDSEFLEYISGKKKINLNKGKVRKHRYSHTPFSSTPLTLSNRNDESKTETNDHRPRYHHRHEDDHNDALARQSRQLFYYDEDDDDSYDDDDDGVSLSLDDHKVTLVTDDMPSVSEDFDATHPPTSLGSSIWDEVDRFGTKHDPERSVGNNTFEGIYQYPYEKFVPSNTITLHMSMAFIHNDYLTSEQRGDLVCMALEAITVVLNDYTLDLGDSLAGGLPFVFTDSDAIANYYEEREEAEERSESEDGENDRRNPRQGRRRQRDRERDRVLHSEASERLSPLILRFGDPPRPEMLAEHVAKVKLHDVSIHLGDHDWWSVAVMYTVWRKPRKAYRSGIGARHGHRRDLLGERSIHSSRQLEPSSRALREDDDDEDHDGEDNDDEDHDDDDEEDHKDDYFDHWYSEDEEYLDDFYIPVRNEKILKKIKGVCRYALDYSIQNQQYWETLTGMPFDYDSEKLILDKTHYCPWDKGVGDVQAPGSVYDLTQRHCQAGGMKDDGKIDGDDSCMQCYPSWPTQAPTDEEPYKIPVSESVMEIEWGIQEWVGMGMMVFTTLWVGIASLVTHVVSKKRNRQRLWGAALTQEGVEDFLQVGWRIHEELPMIPDADGDYQRQQQQQQSQFYLQIYDKGIGPGYNDENSLLQGGFEDQQIHVARSDNHVAPAISTTAPLSSSGQNNTATGGGSSNNPPSPPSSPTGEYFY